MNDHQKLAAFIDQVLGSDALSVGGSQIQNILNARGWLQAIAQGRLVVGEPVKEEVPSDD